jgi:hypothetical protein
MEDWQRKVAVVLLNSGGKRFLSALSNSIANGIPILVQSSLFTVAWMRRILLPVRNENSYSTTTPQLTESPHYGRALNGRMNPSFSQQHLIKNSGKMFLIDEFCVKSFLKGLYFLFSCKESRQLSHKLPQNL